MSELDDSSAKLAESKVMLTRFLLLAFLTLAAGGSPNIRFTVTPQQAFAPATITVTVYLQPNSRNRYLCVDYGSGDEDAGSESSDCQPVNGADAPTQHIRVYRDMPAGSYMFQARRIDSFGDEEHTPMQEVNLLPH